MGDLSSPRLREAWELFGLARPPRQRGSLVSLDCDAVILPQGPCVLLAAGGAALRVAWGRVASKIHAQVQRAALAGLAC